MNDIRDTIFKGIFDRKITATITAEKGGCLSGIDEAEKAALEIGIEIGFYKNEGDELNPGDKIAWVSGSPKQITVAEDRIIGCMSKFSGIATAARRAVSLADGRIRIVSGSLKKMPNEIKGSIRKAIATGGADVRISRTPMVYLDKNYIRMLGSIKDALKSVEELDNLVKVIQIKGKDKSVVEETLEAIEGGCNLLMVDSGNIDDLEECLKTLESTGKGGEVKVAFSGGIKIVDIPELCRYKIEALCIGKEIVDALLLDMKLDVSADMKGE